MDIGQGLVSGWLRDAVDICMVGNLKEAKINGSKDQKGWGKRKRKKKEHMSEPTNS